MIAQHSSKSNEHYTPGPICDRARLLMGSIDLDPASCLKANETVKAKQIYDVADDGLPRPWFGRVFLNPPGGTYRNENGVWVPVERNEEGRLKGPGESAMRVWWQRLAEQYEAGNVFQGFFVAFNLEILRTSQQGIPIQRYWRCYPSDRIHFNGAPSPTHANVLAYLPEKTATGKPDPVQWERFCNIFGDIGFCERGANG